MVFYVCLVLCIVPSVSFYSSKGRPRLQGVVVGVGLDRGITLTYSRPLYRRGPELSCYKVLWWWWRVHFLSLSLVYRLVLAWVWARLSRVVGALTSVAQSFPRKGHAYSRVRRHMRLCYVGALTLNVSRGVVMGYYACCTMLACTFLQSWG